MRIKYLLIFISLLVINSSKVFAQDLSRIRDLASIKVDVLSESEIQKIRQQLTNAGVTIDNVRSQLMMKGMSPSEFLKLKSRLASTSTANKSSSTLNIDQSAFLPKSTNRKLAENSQVVFGEDSLDLSSLLESNLQKSLIDSRIFGSELFNSRLLSLSKSSFQPDYKIATPLNYELGPGDEVNLVVFGQQEYSDNLTISPEGFINIFNVGLVKISGLSIEAAQVKLRQVLMSAYPTLKTGSSKLSVTLGDIRTIHVTVIGANYPGSMDVPSLSTVYSVLSKAGGPTGTGSFRNIELVRDNKIIKIIDLYRLIAKGNQSDNIRLRDNDVLRIPSYQKRIELVGQVKRPGLFEVLPHEKFKDILDFAGGFDDTAYTSLVKVIRKNSKEKEIIDLNEHVFNNFELNSGDQIVVSKILDRFTNRVKITGAVFRPDNYSYKEGMRISDLLEKADGLKEDAFMERGTIIRLKDDQTKEIVSFNLRDVIAHVNSQNILLKREDEVFISSVVDMKDSLKVTIQGEVHLPGTYFFMDGMTLKSLILQAGGLTDASSDLIEIGRIIKRESVEPSDLRVSIVETIHLNDSLKFNGNEFALQPYDVVNVRKKIAYNNVGMILVVGQAQQPGTYALQNANERVSDLYKRIGGLLPDANPDGVYLKRFKTDDERKRISDATKRIQTLYADESKSVLMDVEKEFDRIPVDLQYILNHPGSMQDVILRPRDELVIPAMDNQVRVSGAVIQSTQIPFQSEKSLRGYVYAAGGYSREAWKKRAYIVYANGKASAVRAFLIFRKYPKVKPGSEIIIPKIPDAKAKGLTTGELVGLSSAIASLAGVVIAILKL